MTSQTNHLITEEEFSKAMIIREKIGDLLEEICESEDPIAVKENFEYIIQEVRLRYKLEYRKELE